MTILFAALAAVVLLVITLPVGAYLALIRDQGQPYYLPEDVKKRLKAEGKIWSKWKESGITLVGVTFGGLVAWRYGTDLEAAAMWGIGVGAWSATAWSLGHRKGLDLSNALDWVAMCGTGLAVTFAVAAAMIWHGDIVTGLVVGLAGAMKGPAYWVGYKMRGRTDHSWPHATAIGAMIHGAIHYSVTTIALSVIG